MSAVRDFEELAIFQKARELSKKIYPVTNRDGFKSDFRFVQQIRAAAGSIMDNIAEGFERTGNKEFLNFLYIAKGSCGEVRSQLIRANDVGYLTPEEFDELYSECRKLSAGIMNFIKEIKASDLTGAKFKEFNG
ncbi:four helix bundle protein [Prevotella communis]|uniref:four helix bundle protein n=1 Tax=Prevotella communis TaxID=2913614 RepID=UPI001ED9E2AD|nr:four helix bundle protein [Prevotella communis]UKK62334.1 four helix bundle protein [Prevotella communis]UKK65161.1 four helix bundle protein [Prevotella communis]